MKEEGIEEEEVRRWRTKKKQLSVLGKGFCVEDKAELRRIRAHSRSGLIQPSDRDQAQTKTSVQPSVYLFFGPTNENWENDG